MEKLISDYAETMDFLKGYETRYKINPQGEIFSILHNKIMKYQESEDGYFCIMLMSAEKRQKMRIHRLLALQYIPNPEELLEIDHIDRNKKNNALDNLRWASRITNANNKESSLKNLTEEETKKRTENIKEYKKDWATKDRREKGIEPKKHLTEEDHKKYKAEWMAKKRTSMTAEEKEEELAKRRANKKPQTEEQKANAKERAKMQRLAIKADPDALAKAREYKRLKAQEYRLKKSDVA